MDAPWQGKRLGLRLLMNHVLWGALRYAAVWPAACAFRWAALVMQRPLTLLPARPPACHAPCRRGHRPDPLAVHHWAQVAGPRWVAAQEGGNADAAKAASSFDSPATCCAAHPPPPPPAGNAPCSPNCSYAGAAAPALARFTACFASCLLPAICLRACAGAPLAPLPAPTTRDRATNLRCPSPVGAGFIYLLLEYFARCTEPVAFFATGERRWGQARRHRGRRLGRQAVGHQAGGIELPGSRQCQRSPLLCRRLVPGAGMWLVHRNPFACGWWQACLYMLAKLVRRQGAGWLPQGERVHGACTRCLLLADGPARLTAAPPPATYLGPHSRPDGGLLLHRRPGGRPRPRRRARRHAARVCRCAPLLLGWRMACCCPPMGGLPLRPLEPTSAVPPGAPLAQPPLR